MERPSNFQLDNDIYGKFGERVFAEYAKSKGWAVVDVSDDPYYQLIDVDYVHIKDATMTVHDFFHRWMFKRPLEKRKNSAIMFEVKADTRVGGTGNVLYEIISHDGPGCLAISRADFIFYVQVNDDGTKAEKAWNINLNKWRTWLRENGYYINSKGFAIRLHNFNRTNDKVLNALCKIETMVEEGFAVEVDLSKFWKNERTEK